MPLIRRALIIGVGCAIVGTVVVSRAGAAPVTADVEAAFEQLERPSIPTPLPGSTPFGESGWHIDEACSTVLADYQAPGAPAPANASATVGPGRLTWMNPYGASAVIAVYDYQGGTQDGAPIPEPGTCDYRLLATPNIVVNGPGRPGPLAEFGPVGCLTNSDNEPRFFAAYDALDGVQLVALSDGSGAGPTFVVLPETTSASVGAHRALSDPSAQSYLAHDIAKDADVITFTIDTPDGPSGVTVVCTGSSIDVPEFMKYVGN